MNIALTFSGGGFRAAAFSLGSISLLNSIIMEDGTLLDQVTVLSTVSGGTITGARYALGKKRDESFAMIYQSLYQFLSKPQIVPQALETLANSNGWNDKRVRNLVTAFSDIYDRELFAGAKFGDLMTDPVGKGLRHTSFNSTEFATALQFRFQWSEKILHPGPNESERGIIGNNNFRVNASFAKNIRLADILAASSCFPGGFEPINFPDDFVLIGNEGSESLSPGKYPVGLMDGGIVDNQGIEPILLAEARMKRNRGDLPGEAKPNVIDLVMVCEVASPDMDGYRSTQQTSSSWWRALTPKTIAIVNSILLLLSLGGGFWSYIANSKITLILSTVIFTINLIVGWSFNLINTLAKNSGIPAEFLKPLGKLLKLKLFIYENLITNRFNSVLMLTMSVFLKHVRRLNYNVLYKDVTWKNRRIMNAIYELKSDESQLKKKITTGLLPRSLSPSKLIEANSDLAASMGTTLWFTKTELEETKMLESIIACGQYNTCWNLLEYIHLLKLNNENTNAEHEKLIACENQLNELWAKFQTNPKWLLNKFD
ncbi:patatin-like phospholipase family protein [Mucilaginibacter aquaedulcis]|uniref:patatin-like phospholipase family protein n=1 Tax=Mucilaginibacter aquaedulcis TaxID=1187081 RepID=UPI0025B55F85|nr:patatin-like phospholipase family protein [Mucilaginibacter aquaedulcis]MDN3548960.1 patatin-like phospholipase family protein [Mucilaginibacter aquaedulcis]